MLSIPTDFYFQERESLDDFQVDDESCIFHALYRKIVCVDDLVDIENIEWSICQIFNDACYIVAFVLHEKRPIVYIKNFWSYARGENIKGVGRSRNFKPGGKVRGDVVMIVTWLLLRKVNDKSVGAMDFFNTLGTQLRSSANVLLADFNISCPETLSQNVFTFEMPEITERFARQFSWVSITKYYDKKRVRDIVCHLGKTPREREIIIKAMEYEIRYGGDFIKGPLNIKCFLAELRREFTNKEANHSEIIGGHVRSHEIATMIMKETTQEATPALDDASLTTQKESLQRENAFLKAEVDRLKNQPTQERCLKDLLIATKNLFRHDLSKADIVRQVLLKMKCDATAEDLDKWIEGRKSPNPSLKVENMSVSSLSAAQVNDIHGNNNVNLEK